MFAAGLKPKGFRLHNDTSWLKDTNGISFGKLGIAYTPSAIYNAPLESLTIEVALKMPRQRRNNLDAVFDIWNAKGRRHIELCQWDSSLMVVKSSSPYFKDTRTKICKSVSPEKQHLVTITSRRNFGTDLYIDGVLVRHTGSFDLCDSGVSLGSLVLGNSSDGKNPWHGEIHAFTIHKTALSASEVMSRYDDWNKSRILPALEASIAVYPFDERKGDLAYNHAGKSVDVNFPLIFYIPQKQFLVPFWEDFCLKLDLFFDYAVNLAGFIPLGFFLCALLWSFGGFWQRKSVIITLVTGSLMSLSIEIAQAYIPTRSSQMSDLILNIAGTLIGIFIFLKYNKRQKKAGNFPA
jgi:hypothetical protein